MFLIIQFIFRLEPAVSCLLKANAGLQKAKGRGFVLNHPVLCRVSILYEPRRHDNFWIQPVIWVFHLYGINKQNTTHIRSYNLRNYSFWAFGNRRLKYPFSRITSNLYHYYRYTIYNRNPVCFIVQYITFF